MRRKIRLFLLLIIIAQSHFAQKMTLDDCILFAEKHNKDLINKLQNNIISNIEHKEEISKLFPMLNLNLGADYYWKIPVQSYPGELIGQPEGTSVAIPIGSTWMSEATIELKWKLLDFNVLQNIKLQSIKKENSKYQHLSFSRILQRNVIMAYYIVQVRKEEVSFVNDNLEYYISVHNYIQQQYDKGLIDKISMNQSQNILSKYEESVYKKKSELANSQIDLKFWMGYPFEDALEIENINIKPSLEKIIFNENDHPDYEYEKSKIDISMQEYNSIKSTLLPSVSLIGNYAKSGFSENFKNLTKSQSWYSSGFIGVRLCIPIVHPTNIAKIKKAKFQKKQSLLEYEIFFDKEKSNYLKNLNDFNNISYNLKSNHERLNLVEENKTLSLSKVEKGLIDLIQLKDIQNELLETHEQYIIKQINCLKLFVEINYLQNNTNIK